MKTHRCFHDATLATGDVISPVEAEVHHLLRVRRARPGDRIVVINGRGAEVDARLVDPSARHPVLELLDATRMEQQPPALPILAPALTPDTESLVMAAVELGVAAFRPLLSARCTMRGAEKKPEALQERWRRLAIASIKQCERLWLPTIHAPSDLKSAMAEMLEAGERVICLAERSDKARPLVELLAESTTKEPTILVGPEGGWDNAELHHFAGRGIPLGSLGDAILRAETACLAALASSLAHRHAHRAPFTGA